jgi:hypothetical protein
VVLRISVVDIPRMLGTSDEEQTELADTITYSVVSLILSVLFLVRSVWVCVPAGVALRRLAEQHRQHVVRDRDVHDVRHVNVPFLVRRLRRRRRAGLVLLLFEDGDAQGFDLQNGVPQLWQSFREDAEVHDESRPNLNRLSRIPSDFSRRRSSPWSLLAIEASSFSVYHALASATVLLHGLRERGPPRTRRTS